MIDNKTELTIMGLMSGTSLDGLDICVAKFENSADSWSYEIICADTFDYSDDITSKLSNAQKFNAFEIILFHKQYGKYSGERINEFIDKYDCKPDYIASHGHTIFHRPDLGLTYQTGDGASIAAVTGIPVICDFRSVDAALGGQGAPLVPIGDRHLFGEYDYCLNIGGFANISFETQGTRIAFDVSPANFVLNGYANLRGRKYDKDGKMAESGKCFEPMLNALNRLDFYRESGPKSLGREWVEDVFMPVAESYDITPEDKLCTVCEHIAMQISRYAVAGKMLVTGGGAYNGYLTSRIKKHCKSEIVIPDNVTINYKEALVFAFLGALYLKGKPNCLSSVTGASGDNIGGAMYIGYRR